MNFILQISSKCGQGGRGSNNPKILQMSYINGSSQTAKIVYDEVLGQSPCNVPLFIGVGPSYKYMTERGPLKRRLNSLPKLVFKVQIVTKIGKCSGPP